MEKYTNGRQLPTGYTTVDTIPSTTGIKGEEVIIGWEEAPTRAGYSPITAYMVTTEQAIIIEEAKQNILSENQKKIQSETQKKEEIKKEYEDFISPYIGKKVGFVEKDGSIKVEGEIASGEANIQNDFTNLKITLNNPTFNGKKAYTDSMYVRMEEFGAKVKIY